MFTIHSSLFNLESLRFPWQDSIENWVQFLGGEGEIILVLNKSKDNSEKILEEFVTKLRIKYAYMDLKINIIKTEFGYDDPEFDGKIKNVGYKAAKEPLVILLDLDEVVPILEKRNWILNGYNLLNSEFDAYMIPSINLCKTWQEYKDIGAKFYMVKNKPNIGRGTVNYAKNPDGSIDITKSDTTEPIYDNGDLVKYTTVIPQGMPDYMQLHIIQNGAIFVFHLGWLWRDHRVEVNKFWKPVWENRAKKKIDDIITDVRGLENIPVKSHNLVHWEIR